MRKDQVNKHKKYHSLSWKIELGGINTPKNVTPFFSSFSFMTSGSISCRLNDFPETKQKEWQRCVAFLFYASTYYLLTFKKSLITVKKNLDIYLKLFSIIKIFIHKNIVKKQNFR